MAQALPYRCVIVSTDMSLQNQWCNTHCSAPWASSYYDWDHTEFLFWNQDDAIHFVLTWGGSHARL